MLVSQTFVLISIHAPLTGCDICKTFQIPIGVISIHAPLTGCDIKSPP